jgi:hypothetical protein
LYAPLSSKLSSSLFLPKAIKPARFILLPPESSNEAKKSKDGASALQKHYELFENELGTLYAVRNNIYKLSEAVFSAQ